MPRSRAPTLVSSSRVSQSGRLLFGLKEAVELHQLTLEAENRATSTRYFYRLVLDTYCEYLRTDGEAADAARLNLGDLNAKSVRQFILWIKDGAHGSPNRLSGRTHPKGPKTILEYTRALKGFSRFCVREGLLGTDPLSNVRPPKVPVKVIPTFTGDQIKALLRVVDQHAYARRNEAIIYLLLATGVRASELCNLKVADVDIKTKRAKVFGKGSKERMVGFDPLTGKRLLLYLAERKSDTPWLFLGRGGVKMTRNSLLQLLKGFGDEAGINQSVRCTPHTFRHTFAVQFLETHPGALFHLQELLGHTDLEMVRRYAKIAKGHEILEGPSIIESLGLDKGPRRR